MNDTAVSLYLVAMRLHCLRVLSVRSILLPALNTLADVPQAIVLRAKPIITDTIVYPLLQRGRVDGGGDFLWGLTAATADVCESAAMSLDTHRSTLSALSRRIVVISEEVTVTMVRDVAGAPCWAIPRWPHSAFHL